MKILVSAYAVSPIRGSECAVGWELTKGLGNYFDVTVLMCYETPSGDKFYQELCDYFAVNGEVNNVKYIPVSMPLFSKIFTYIHDIGFWPAYYLGYNLWQRKAYRYAKRLHSELNFDFVYQLNMIGFREPGYLWKLKIPFYWGPINGFHCIPFPFIIKMSLKNIFFQTLKHIFNYLQIKFSLRARKTAKVANLVFCVDRKAVDTIKRWGGKAILLQESALAKILFISSRKDYSSSDILKIIWCGMITPGKALDILLESLLYVKNLNFILTIVGDGPEKKLLKKNFKEIDNKIIWKGWLPRKEVLEEMKKSNILIHTSLKEGTPHVILESISTGLPVICHDTCGMGEIINNDNGFKIPYYGRKSSVEALINLLNSILEQPEILNIKYKKISDSIDCLTWDLKVKRISEYILSGRFTK